MRLVPIVRLHRILRAHGVHSAQTRKGIPETMTTLRDRIEKRLREEVCTTCQQDRPDSGCDEAGDRNCALMARMDEVIEVIGSVRDYSLMPYQDRLRQVICTDCADEHDGTCSRRDSRECALDAYFPTIVAVIEKELAADPGIA